MVDPNRLRAIRNQVEEGVEAIKEAEERLEEMTDADRVQINVSEEKTSAHITWRQEDD